MAETTETGTEQSKDIKMVAASKSKKMVKVRALRPFTRHDSSLVVQPGETIEVPEEIAADLCRVNKGAFSFRGERYEVDGDCSRNSLTRAELVQVS